MTSFIIQAAHCVTEVELATGDFLDNCYIRKKYNVKSLMLKRESRMAFQFWGISKTSRSLLENY